MGLMGFLICFIISGIFIGINLAPVFGVLAACFLGWIGGLIFGFLGAIYFDLD